MPRAPVFGRCQAAPRAAVLAALAALPAGGAAAFVNGDFETGTLTGWTYGASGGGCGTATGWVQARGVGSATGSCGGNLVLPFAGNGCVEVFSSNGLSNHCRMAWIEQEVAVPSANETVTFAFAAVFQSAHGWVGDPPGNCGNTYLRLRMDVVGGLPVYEQVFDGCSQFCDPAALPSGCPLLTCPVGSVTCATSCACGSSGGNASSVVLPWCAHSIAVVGQAGQMVRFRMETYECAYGGHWARGFLDNVALVPGAPTPTVVSPATRTPTPIPTAPPTAASPPPHVYPNPATRSDAGPDRVIFAGIPAGGSLEVFNLRGERIARLEGDPSGNAVWPLRDAGAVRVSGGVYVCLFRDVSRAVSARRLLAVR